MGQITEPLTKLPEQQSDTISPEQELNLTVVSGDFERLPQLPAFQNRSPESQVHLVAKAIDQRIGNINRQITLFVNKPNDWQTTMGMLARINKLKLLKEDLLRQFYEGEQRQIASVSGVKIDFY